MEFPLTEGTRSSSPMTNTHTLLALTNLPLNAHANPWAITSKQSTMQTPASGLFTHSCRPSSLTITARAGIAMLASNGKIKERGMGSTWIRSVAALVGTTGLVVTSQDSTSFSHPQPVPPGWSTKWEPPPPPPPPITPMDVVPEASSQTSAIKNKQEWENAKDELVNKIRLALCPTMVPNYIEIEHVDSELSVRFSGTYCPIGYQIVLSEKNEFYLSEATLDPHKFPTPFKVKEYIEIILIPENISIPEDAANILQWVDFVSIFHLQVVDMGLGYGFHWFGRVHLWEQDDIRERLRLVGGQDRLQLMEMGMKIRDRGGMTSNSMKCRLDRVKKPGSN